MAIKHNHPIASKLSTLLSPVPYPEDDLDQSTPKKRSRINSIDETTTTATADERKKDAPMFLSCSWTMLQHSDYRDDCPTSPFRSPALSMECKRYKMMMTTMPTRDLHYDTATPMLMAEPPRVLLKCRAKKCIKFSNVRGIPPLPFQWNEMTWNQFCMWMKEDGDFLIYIVCDWEGLNCYDRNHLTTLRHDIIESQKYTPHIIKIEPILCLSAKRPCVSCVIELICPNSKECNIHGWRE